MRNFHIPFDMHTEDKIIGGYLSLRQFAWVLIAGFIDVYLFAINKSYIVAGGVNAFSLAIRIIFAIIVSCFGIFLAFFTLEELSADSYIWKKIIFKNKKRIIKYTDKK